MKYIYLISITLISITIIILFIRLEKSAENTFYIEPDKVYENFTMRKKLQSELEKSLQKDTKLLDSLYESLGHKSDTKQKSDLDNLQHQLKVKNNEIAEKFDSQIWAQINQYIIDYGEENNITFILGANGTGAVFFAKPEKNITQNIIEYINKKYQNN